MEMMKQIFWHLESVVGMRTLQLGICSTHCSPKHVICLIHQEGHAYSKFMLVSDRDKGLDKLLAETFPRNHATNCVHHIK